MIVHADDPGHAAALLCEGEPPVFVRAGRPSADVHPLIERLFDPGASLWTARMVGSAWAHVLVRSEAPLSQYDRLIDCARSTVLPDRIACLAGSGSGFHGSAGRAWSALPGNIHLTVHLSPQAEVPRFETVFTALAAVSVIDAIDSIPALRGSARIKWVNDVLVDGAKVAGVLAYTQSRGRTVSSVVLGIGLNVGTAPAIRPTSFVERAGCIRDSAAAREPSAARAVTVPAVLHALLDALAKNCADVLEHGHAPVMDRYRQRSAIIGRAVTVWPDHDVPGEVPLAAGRVAGIGDGLELLLEGGAEPVTRGRLRLEDSHGSVRRAS